MYRRRVIKPVLDGNREFIAHVRPDQRTRQGVAVRECGRSRATDVDLGWSRGELHGDRPPGVWPCCLDGADPVVGDPHGLLVRACGERKARDDGAGNECPTADSGWVRRDFSHYRLFCGGDELGTQWGTVRALRQLVWPKRRRPRPPRRASRWSSWPPPSCGIHVAVRVRDNRYGFCEDSLKTGPVVMRLARDPAKPGHHEGHETDSWWRLGRISGIGRRRRGATGRRRRQLPGA